jgi:NodT family efflux transporter outer membrane factor (OMF) lipoprotein
MNDAGANGGSRACATGRRTSRDALVLAVAPLVAGLALLAGLAGGCAVGPDFKRPAPPALDGYLPPEPAAPRPEQPEPPSSPAEMAQRVELGRQIPAQWWGLFHCPRLDATLRQAIAASNSLAAAKATLAQAREAVVVARAALYPQLDLGASVRRGSAGLGGAATSFSLGPTAGYSIDAFGGTRRRVEQEAALADNQRYQLAAAYLTLTGNAVTTAIAIASTRLQIATVEDLIRNDQKNLGLVQRELDAGKVARSEVLTAAAQLESDRTQLPNLHQQLSVSRHALAVLAGKAPVEWSPPDFDIGELTLPDELPVSLPSELVRQRPDILAAEAQLHADSAAIGVATAQMYPSITLSASLVQESLALARLFQSASRTWSAGSSLDAPLYRGGALAAQRRAAVDAYDAQQAIYQQTVLQAFGQVADVLSALQHDAELVSASRRALDIAGASLALQRSSYAAGKTSALQLIVAENTYSEARLGNVRALGQRLADTAQLFIAAGGGWWNGGDLASPAEH